MDKIRTLTLNGVTYRVSNTYGILNPGKFEGEKLHAVQDYETGNHDESFGDVELYGFLWRVQKNGLTAWHPWANLPNSYRYYREDSDGFVSELDHGRYEMFRNDYTEECG